MQWCTTVASAFGRQRQEYQEIKAGLAGEFEPYSILRVGIKEDKERVISTELKWQREKSSTEDNFIEP